MKNISNLNISNRTRSVAFNGLLAALALTLSAVELMLPPIPLMPPGAKLGLSNIITMYAASQVGLIPALCIAVIKGLFAGITRGATAMMMSLSGGVLSTFITWALLHLKKNPFGLIGLGVAGALSHNAAQLLVAMFLTTPAVIYYLPFLIIFGVIFGIITGLVLRVIMPLLGKFIIE
jgi:heptaprenyl diphosphate synthase